MEGGARACACEPARDVDQSGREIEPDHRSAGRSMRDRRRSVAHRPARRSAARCKPNSIRHGRDGRSGRSARAGRGIAVADHGRGERIGGGDGWPPSMRRSVQKSAPPARSGRSVENSSAACASQPHPHATNHPESPKSRSGSRHYVARFQGINPDDQRCISAAFRTVPYSDTKYREYLRLNPQPISGKFPIISQIAGILNNRC